MALAFVTGSSRGIGRAVALYLARDGYDIIVHCRDRLDAAEEVAAQIRALGRTAHTSVFDTSAGPAAEEAVSALIRDHGCPDVLVNNAGITQDALFAMMKRSTWERVVDTNLGSFYSVTRPLVRAMIRRRSGRIVNIASFCGQRGNAGQVNYSASKAGLIGATKALALEVASRGITVNAVSPGFITTDMTASLDTEEICNAIPLGRAGTPEDVAAAVSFLCSEGAAYITGQVLAVNGGLYV